MGQRNSISGSLDKKVSREKSRDVGKRSLEAIYPSHHSSRRPSNKDGVDLRVRTVVCAITLGPKKQTSRVELRHFNFELGFAVYGPLGAVYIPVILKYIIML